MSVVILWIKKAEYNKLKATLNVVLGQFQLVSNVTYLYVV